VSIPTNNQSHHGSEHAGKCENPQEPALRLDANVHVGPDVGIVQIILNRPERKPADEKSLEHYYGHERTAVPRET